MTIDEAITHARKIADENSDCWKNCLNNSIRCNQCEQEHEQLVAWLEELKAYRTLDKTNFSDGFNKAIDEILSIVKYYADKWDGIYHAIKRIEELKGELK